MDLTDTFLLCLLRSIFLVGLGQVEASHQTAAGMRNWLFMLACNCVLFLVGTARPV
jgi:hypothetical protein